MRKKRSIQQLSGDDVIIETVWLYYRDGFTQAEIAKKLNISRPTVVNYLQLARENNLVSFSLNEEAFLGHELSHQMRDIFGLKAVYIVPNGNGDKASQTKRVTKAAAEWLPHLLQPNDVLGVAWGKHILDVVNNMKQTPLADVTVVPLLGSMPSPYGVGSEICAGILASAIGASYIHLHCPAIVSNKKLAQQLRSEPIIAESLNMIQQCNKAIFAAGSCHKNSHVVTCNLVDADQLHIYAQQGASAVLCGKLIDKDGNPMHPEYEDRIMGVDLETLKKLDMSILVSAGRNRVKPMLAALKGKYATHVATNVQTAKQLIALADK